MEGKIFFSYFASSFLSNIFFKNLDGHRFWICHQSGQVLIQLKGKK